MQATIMLRIARRIGLDGIITVSLEGKLLHPWIAELANHFPEGTLRKMNLNLSDVLFIDAAGVQFLRGLRERGLELESSSPFIGELLSET